MRRFMPRPLRALWRRYQPEPIEFCSGFGLVFLGLSAALTDDMTFTPWAAMVLAVGAVVGIVAMLATLAGWPPERRGDLALASFWLWSVVVGVNFWVWGWNTREAAPAALALGSLLAWVKDWDAA